MRIGFDGKRAVQNKTGLGNYSRFIIDILSRFHKENQYIIYAPKPKENKVLDRILSRENIQLILHPIFGKKSVHYGEFGE
jgi:hypothetical protein